MKVAMILEAVLVHRAPNQRCGATMARDHRNHNRCVLIVCKVRPIHGQHNLAACTDDIGHPFGERGPHINALVGQQSVHLFKRVFEEQATRLRQSRANRLHTQGRASQHASCVSEPAKRRRLGGEAPQPDLHPVMGLSRGVSALLLWLPPQRPRGGRHRVKAGTM